jgi:hypothetical protein
VLEFHQGVFGPHPAQDPWPLTAASSTGAPRYASGGHGGEGSHVGGERDDWSRRRGWLHGARSTAWWGASTDAAMGARLLSGLQLHTFTARETGAAFDRYDVNGDGVLQRHEVTERPASLSSRSVCVCVWPNRYAHRCFLREARPV